ncbi:MAG TPA: serine/threonine-protein kinase [Gaiellaceae bacterium]|nr:serine/threonine-protein kinase [Gaiellaceae bacterium]
MSDELLAGRYVLGPSLGAGGSASVRLATDTLLDRPVAVKVLAGRLGGDEEFRRRFLREGRLAAKLSHPNVVRVFDSGEVDGRPYLVMECVDGRSLDDHLRRHGPLPPADVAALGRQAAAGLGHVHDAGLVHRDVKPQNLLLRDDGLLKLVDFGIARDGGQTITEAGTLLGTAGYMPPEVAAGERATPASDLYSLGAVLYELLTGRPPRRVDSLDDLNPDIPIPHPAELRPEAPAPLTSAIARCLERDPGSRPDSAAELALALEPTAKSSPAPTQLRTTGVRPRRGRPHTTRMAWPALAAVAALALVALAVGFAAGGRNDPEPRTPTPVAPVPPAADPAGEARNLASWLRENAG